MGNDLAADVIGTIQYEFVDCRARKPASESLADLRLAMTGVPGVEIEVAVPQAGPPTGKAIQVQLSADDPAALNEVARSVADRLARVPEVIDISNGLPPPGVDRIAGRPCRRRPLRHRALDRSGRWCSW